MKRTPSIDLDALDLSKLTANLDGLLAALTTYQKRVTAFRHRVEIATVLAWQRVGNAVVKVEQEIERLGLSTSQSLQGGESCDAILALRGWLASYRAGGFWKTPQGSKLRDAADVLSELELIGELFSAWRPKVNDKSTRRRPGKPFKGETPAETKIIGALTALLRDDDHPIELPPSGRKVATTADVSPNTVKDFMKKVFKSQAQFEAAWRRGDVPPTLARLQYAPERHEEYNDDLPARTGSRRAGRAPGSHQAE